MLYIVTLIIGVVIGVVCPAHLGVFLTIANFVIPDPIPGADEIGMVVGVVMRGMIA